MSPRGHDPEVDSAAYVSGVMRARGRRRFERHLLTCEMCWSEVRLDREGRRLAELGREASPVGLRNAVRAAVAVGPERQPGPSDARSEIPASRTAVTGRPGWRVPAIAMAAAFFVIAGSLLWFGGSGEPGPISAALDAYEHSAVVGTDHHMKPPDLTRLGLQATGAEAMALAGMPVEAFAYLSPGGSRLTLFMGHAPFPRAAEAGPSTQGAWRAQHERVTLCSGTAPVAYLVVSSDARLVDHFQAGLADGTVSIS